MIIQGNNDDFPIAIPKEVENAAHIYACFVDSTGVLKEWKDEDVLIKRGILVLPLEREDTVNLPRGAIYVEVYAKDIHGNLFWSRKIPEYVDNRYGNLGKGVIKNTETLHGEVIT